MEKDHLWGRRDGFICHVHTKSWPKNFTSKNKRKKNLTLSLKPYQEITCANSYRLLAAPLTSQSGERILHIIVCHSCSVCVSRAVWKRFIKKPSERFSSVHLLFGIPSTKAISKCHSSPFRPCTIWAFRSWY